MDRCAALFFGCFALRLTELWGPRKDVLVHQIDIINVFLVWIEHVINESIEFGDMVLFKIHSNNNRLLGISQLSMCGEI